MVFRIPGLGLTLQDLFVLGVIGYAILLYDKADFREKQLVLWGKLLDKVWELVQKFFKMGTFRTKEDKATRRPTKKATDEPTEDPLADVEPLEKPNPLDELDELEEGL